MRLSLATVALVAAFTTLSAHATPMARSTQVLTCDSEPGRGLCREMRLLESYMVDCTGASCYDLWRGQVRSMQVITDTFYRDVDPGATAEPQMGRSAEYASRAICGAHWTGDPNWIRRLAVAANRALRALDLLQEAAGEPFPYTCTLVVNRSTGQLSAE